MTATNPTHAWQTSTSPAEMVRMVGGADGPMRERLRVWVKSCRRICKGWISAEAREASPVDRDDILFWMHEQSGPSFESRCSLLRCVIPAQTCPACEGHKKEYESCGPDSRWVKCGTCSATGLIFEPPAIDPRWLSGTVCDLARIVRFGDMEERLCPNCDGSRKATGVISRRPVKLGKKECKPCQGVGKRTMRTLKPRFDLMPFLADALMDSGADDESIIAHLQDDKFHCSDCWAIKVLNAAR